MFRLTPLSVKIITIILFATAFSKGIVNVFSNPPWQAADEPMHFEAALISGDTLPHLTPQKINDTNRYQSIILQVMANHRFFQRIGIPEPIPLPDSFKETPFIRDAPSKIGRQPLFYIVSGLLLRLMTNGMLESLYLARLLNLSFILTALILFNYSIKKLYPANPAMRLLSLLFMVTQPTLWHLCSSMNSEAWKMLLMCAGLFLTIEWYNTTKITRPMIVTYTIWLMMVALSSWTLLPFVLMMLSAILLPRVNLKKKSTWVISLLFTLALTAVVTFFVWASSDYSLLRHEANHVITGIIRLTTGHFPLKIFLHQFFESFWAGFGWLTIPAPDYVLINFALLSVIGCAGVVFYVEKVISKRGCEPLSGTICSIIVTGMLMVVIRASSQEASIQGRYLFPILPMLFIAITRGLFLIPNRTLKRFVIAIAAVAAVWGDVSANIKGWVSYQHIDYQSIKDPARSLQLFEWSHSTDSCHILDARHPKSDSFFSKGWYPPETNRSHRWMLNRAEILLPLLAPMESRLEIEIYPYSVPAHETRELAVYFNDHLLANLTIFPGWRKYSFDLKPEFFRSGSNCIILETPEAFSPKDFNESHDSRFLSVAVRRLEIFPAIVSSANDTNRTGWFFSPESNAILVLNPEDSISVIGAESGDFLLLTQVNGKKLHSWLIPGESHKVDVRLEFSDVQFQQAKQHRAVSAFLALKQSLSTLPSIFSDVYVHLFLVMIWLFFSLTGLAFFLLYDLSYSDA